MKKIIKISLVIVLLVSITLLSFKYIENIEADSGWDSSYDSGGSWDSGSDWGGSSWDNDYDYDYDYDYDNDYSGGSSSGGSYSGDIDVKIAALVIGGVFLFVIISFVVSMLKMITRTMNSVAKTAQHFSIKNKQISLEEANAVISHFNIEEFNFKAYQIFYDVQMAWMDFDYDKLKDLLTDELYNNYVMQLDTLKLKNHKNTMKGFELIETRLSNLKEENDKYIAEVYLQVKFYDYVENIKTGMILRGTPNRKLNNIYKLTFIRTKDESNNINECPRCGAPVEGNSTGICEYCKSKLVNDNYNWVMSKKEIVRQK